MAAAQVRGGLGLDHRQRDTEGDLPVDASVTAGLLRVVVLDGDLVAEEPGRACAGVGDQRLVLGEFELEFVTQERRQRALGKLTPVEFQASYTTAPAA
ncbi:hypothetical protein [Amycolatopsis balhimycina]|uniref:hypothetical protein n=1 Tax=Amycolatopsis balhimycina TaxID=208443 RepID=UPI001B7FCC0A|nr:hypothetical protein [Amycolatopsis balhimycina]